MRAPVPKLTGAIAVGLAAVALAAPGSASAASTRVCPNNYTVTSTALAWFYPLQDLNKDGYICVRYDRYGMLYAIADDVVR